ncbi:LysR family transcriptional regulator [Roseomonas sp. KE2513]|uniref:LysR family transcriptional regulator n=1 Tax=Roseomonas sp. KE2513 TaxID=2479202 RepID=UPI0028159B9C|nr:LysR family transcriptional regulator [Roseomonas sp. KE2513]
MKARRNVGRHWFAVSSEARPARCRIALFCRTIAPPCLGSPRSSGERPDADAAWSALLELRQFRYFVTVGRQRHFGRAAALLRVAQPALSRQVAKLEAELGVQLLERHDRGVSLTAEGEVLLARAEAVLAEAGALLEEARAQPREPQGTVSLGFSPSVAELFGGRLAALSLRRYPQVRLRITTAASPVLEVWIKRVASTSPS